MNKREAYDKLRETISNYGDAREASGADLAAFQWAKQVNNAQKYWSKIETLLHMLVNEDYQGQTKKASRSNSIDGIV